MLSSKEIEALLSGKNSIPIATYSISADKILIGVYQGKLKPLDIVVKHRIKDSKGKWNRLRQPSHLQWAVDLIVKRSHRKKKTKEFLSILKSLWGTINGASNENERKDFLKEDNILNGIKRLPTELDCYGEYDVATLFVLMKLLAFQEKTNRTDAHVFNDVITALLSDKMNYEIINKVNFKRK